MNAFSFLGPAKLPNEVVVNMRLDYLEAAIARLSSKLESFINDFGAKANHVEDLVGQDFDALETRVLKLEMLLMRTSLPDFQKIDKDILAILQTCDQLQSGTGVNDRMPAVSGSEAWMNYEIDYDVQEKQDISIWFSDQLFNLLPSIGTWLGYSRRHRINPSDSDDDKGSDGSALMRYDSDDGDDHIPPLRPGTGGKGKGKGKGKNRKADLYGGMTNSNDIDRMWNEAEKVQNSYDKLYTIWNEMRHETLPVEQRTVDSIPDMALLMQDEIQRLTLEIERDVSLSLDQRAKNEAMRDELDAVISKESLPKEEISVMIDDLRDAELRLIKFDSAINDKRRLLDYRLLVTEEVKEDDPGNNKRKLKKTKPSTQANTAESRKLDVIINAAGGPAAYIEQQMWFRDRRALRRKGQLPLCKKCASR